MESGMLDGFCRVTMALSLLDRFLVAQPSHCSSKNIK